MGNFYYDFNLLPHYIEALFTKMRIAVVYGGDSKIEGSVIYRTQNIRPWKSYQAVANNIQNTLEEIGFKQVFLFPDDMTLIKNLKDNNIHLVWLNTGGVQGYNPMCHTAALLETLGIPYIGHNPLNNSVLDNKHIFKYMIQGLGLKTAPFVTWDSSRGLFIPERNKCFQDAFVDYGGPFIAKPVSGRASHYVYVVDSVSELPDIVAEIYEATRNYVLIERYLPGNEYCVAVGGYVTSTNGKLVKWSEPFTFSEIERALDKEEKIFTSMDKRPITDDRVVLLSKAYKPEIKEQLDEIAKLIYLAFNLNTLVRLDIRADLDGSLNILEVNPKPDLKKPQDGVISLVCKGLEEHNMSYSDLILSIIANRLDYLFTHHRASVPHILGLL